MRKLFLGTAAAGLLFGLGACQDDDFGGSGREREVRISAQLPTELNATRSNENPGAGDMVNRCIMEIYRNGELYGTRHVAAVANQQADFDVRLVAGQSYQLVLWADHANGSPGNYTDDHYNTTSLSNVVITDANEYTGNDDTRDAFFASEPVKIEDAAKSVSVQLRRPFGQLNISTKDMADATGDLRPEKVSVAFKEVHTGINLLTGELTDAVSELSYAAPAELAEEVTEQNLSDVKLSVDYLFAPAGNQQYLADYTMKFYNAEGSEISVPYEFENIPVQRNYQTNVSGYLLTRKADITVSVEEAFAGKLVETVAEVATADDVEAAIEAGATRVIVTEETTDDVTIWLPAKEIPGVEIELPRMGGTLTVDARDNAICADEVSIKNSDENAENAALVIDLPNSTVSVSGKWSSIDATTADETLVVETDTEISTLNLKKGSLKLYGKVDKIEKGQDWSGTVYRCVDSQASLDNLKTDDTSGYTQILFERPTATPLDAEGAQWSKPVIFSAGASVSNVTLRTDAAEISPLQILNCKGNVTLDNWKVSTSINYSVVKVAGSEGSFSLKNSTVLLTSGQLNQSGLNLQASGTNTHLSVNLDNCLIGFSDTKLNTSMSQDFDYPDDMATAFKGSPYSRGITVSNQTGSSNGGQNTIDLTLSNTVIEGVYYCLNTLHDIQLNVKAENSILDGRAAFNIWSNAENGATFSVKNSKLIGRNCFSGPMEEFATIVVNTQNGDDGNRWTANNTITLDNTDVVSDNDPQTETNRQYGVDLRSNAHNKLIVRNRTKFRETKNPRLTHAVEVGNWVNEVEADGTEDLTGCAEGATLLESNVWDGNSLKSVGKATDGKYYVGVPSELHYIVKYGLNGDIVLVRDLDLNNKAWPGSYKGFTGTNYPGKGSYPEVAGTFDGQGHTVKNVKCEAQDTPDGNWNKKTAWDNEGYYCGLFGVFDGTLKNLNLDGAEIFGARSGGLIGRFDGGLVENCHVTNVHVRGGAQKMGALIGYGQGTEGKAINVNNCSATNSLIDHEDDPAGDAACSLGGLIGYLQLYSGATISNNRIENITVVSGNMWDTTDEAASHVFVGDVINISKTEKAVVEFKNNLIRNCKLENAIVTPLATDYFGFYYKTAPSSHPFVHTLIVDGKTLVE